jgi:hypothetical protein
MAGAAAVLTSIMTAAPVMTVLIIVCFSTFSISFCRFVLRQHLLLLRNILEAGHRKVIGGPVDRGGPKWYEEEPLPLTYEAVERALIDGLSRRGLLGNSQGVRE